MTCATTLELKHDRGGVEAIVALKQGERTTFVLRPLDESQKGAPVTEEIEEDLLHETVEYWHRWLNRCTYAGRRREVVTRSALVLKLLACDPTGAMAAPRTLRVP